MKLVIAGGSGQVGHILMRAFKRNSAEITLLTRTPSQLPNTVLWDGNSVGEWSGAVDGADVVINLAGRSVNCRYTGRNLKEMMDSRVNSTRAIGRAIASAHHPPKVWLQASTATIYAHRFDADNDEATGIIGGHEPNVPKYWKISIDIAQAWEGELEHASTPRTRKIALRSAMIMSPDRGGILDTLLGMTRLGFGGSIAGGQQYISWIHEQDFVRALEFLIGRDDLGGAVNLSSPNPLPQKEFMTHLRDAYGIRVGLPATRWMIEVGAFFLRTDSELILKSRRVAPGRLTKEGFHFDFPSWPEAAHDLVQRWRAR